jgi:hypothetical protein
MSSNLKKLPDIKKLTAHIFGSPYKTVRVNDFNKLYILASGSHNEKSGVCKVIQGDIP